MKLKTLLTTLLGTFVLQHAAFCQTNVVQPDQPAVATVTNSVAADVVTNLPVAAEAVTNPPVVVVMASNAPVEVVVVEPAAPTNAAPEVVSIPLIQFQEVPITTAIENLARQANINYLLDPKIAYGQPDQNGQIKPEPTLSIRWENITAEHALTALLDNYGLQMVSDAKTKIVRITTKDPTAPPPIVTRVIQLKYTSVSNMMEAATSSLSDKRSRVVGDTRTSQIIVVATEPEQAAVDSLVTQLDRPTRQVLIETRLVEINSTPTSSKGIDWSGTLQAQNISFGNGNVSGSSTVTTPGAGGTGSTPGGGYGTGGGSSTVSTYSTTVGGGGLALSTKQGLMPNVGFLNADGLHAVLSFINSSADAQIVSTPRVVTLDNETADIEVTRGYPVFNVSSGSANNAGGSSVSYTNVGTKLHVTPRISANDNIWLKVIPEVSSFAGNVSQSVGGGTGAGGASTSQVLSAPTFDFRVITTQVIIPNTATLVMGGLVLDNPVSTATKVPVLGDIPYLGAAFRSEIKTSDKKSLVIFITPTIVKDGDFQIHPNNFLASQPDAKRPTLMDADSAWNSTHPYDWSNPKKTASASDATSNQ
jgi:type II secretory pathway component GspD/PulD (secretin)